MPLSTRITACTRENHSDNYTTSKPNRVAIFIGSVGYLEPRGDANSNRLFYYLCCRHLVRYLQTAASSVIALPCLRVAPPSLPSSARHRPHASACVRARSLRPRGSGTATSELGRSDLRAATGRARARGSGGSHELFSAISLRVFGGGGQGFGHRRRCFIFEASTTSRSKIEQHLQHRLEMVSIINSDILRHIFWYECL
jgi:hypothetical protein